MAHVHSRDEKAAPHVDGLSRRISLLYFAIYLHFGIVTPFLPLWFAYVGLTPTQIGVLLSVPLALRILVAAPVANLADRLRRIREVMFVCVLTTAVLMAGLSAVNAYASLLIFFTIVALCWDPIPVLADGYAVVAVRDRRLDFGRMRVWGSLAFIGGSLLAGWSVEQFGIGTVPWLVVGALLLPLAVIPLLPPDRLFGDNARARTGEWRRVFHDREMLLVMIGGALVLASHAMVNSFGAIGWSAQGYGSRTIGLLTGIAIGTEVIVLWVVQRLLGARSPRLLVMIAALVATGRWLAMIVDPGPVLLTALQLLQGVTAMGSIVGVMLMIAQRMPAHLIATAQGVNAVIAGLATAGATAGAGLLWAIFGTTGYGAMALGAAAGGLLAASAVRAGEAERAALLNSP